MDKILIKVSSKNGNLPVYQTEGSAGADLKACLDEPITLMPGERRLIPTGMRIELPEGVEAQIRARSGLSIKHGITIRENGGTVNVLTFDDADNHVIIVSDNGVGFDTSAPPADDSRSHVGIINIRQRLKEMVDGTLEIDSEIGKGTVATIRIPKNHGTI